MVEVGDRTQQFAMMAKKDTQLLQILICQIRDLRLLKMPPDPWEHINQIDYSENEIGEGHHKGNKLQTGAQKICNITTDNNRNQASSCCSQIPFQILCRLRNKSITSGSLLNNLIQSEGNMPTTTPIISTNAAAKAIPAQAER